MSGFVVLLGVVAIAMLVFAWPGLARAGGSAAATAPQGRSLGAERYAPIYIKYSDIKGEIVPDPSAKLDFLKLNGDGCSKLVVVAMRKAGGEQEEFKTNAAPGAKPGECVYSFKKLPPGDYRIGVAEVHFKPVEVSAPSIAGGKLDKASQSKIALDYKNHKGEAAYYVKYGGSFAKWAPASEGGIWVKGGAKDLKLDGKLQSLTGPVLTYIGPTA